MHLANWIFFILMTSSIILDPPPIQFHMKYICDLHQKETFRIIFFNAGILRHLNSSVPLLPFE